MTADGSASTLDEAWGRIPSVREATAGSGSFTRTRVERIIALVSGLASLALGAQTLVTSFAPGLERPGWHEPLVVTILVPLAAMILACLIGRGVRTAAGVFAIVYVAVLALWPVATAEAASAATDQPWIWYLLNISTLAAVLAFPLPLQLFWAGLAPVLYGVARLIQGGFASDFWIAVSLDVSFAFILGGMILTLGWVFRAVAVNVDATRARAVESYAQAAAADAAEQERVAVAALMHDSVLAALIAAERATTPRERTLAAAMAREALTRLANTEQDAGEGSDEPRAVETIAAEVEAAARDLGASLSVQHPVRSDAIRIPGRVARALALAATQAVANALQHAGGAGLTATVEGDATGVRIEVRDTGGGFDLHDVPDDRLGIRASIVARVVAVGGTAVVDSGERGTTVRLDWREGAA